MEEKVLLLLRGYFFPGSLKAQSRKITGRFLASHGSAGQIAIKFGRWEKNSAPLNSGLGKKISGKTPVFMRETYSRLERARSWKRDREFFYSDSLNAQYYQSRSRRDPVCNIVPMVIEPGTWNLTVFRTCSTIFSYVGRSDTVKDILCDLQSDISIRCNLGNPFLRSVQH